jgi:hypothetical protein
LHQRQDFAEHRQRIAAASLLGTLTLELGDRRIEEQWWDIDDDRQLAAVPSTVWQLLEQGGFLRCRRWRNKISFRLTLSGWVAGLEAAGKLRTEAFRARCVRLLNYLARQVTVQGSPRGAVISPERLEADEFASGWVLNVVRSDLMKLVFPDRCMNVRWDPALQNVRVPPTFGSPLSPHVQDIDTSDVVGSA